MAVPVPIVLSLKPPPAQWTSSSPDKYADLVALIAQSLSGTMDIELLTGQVGGSQPSTDIGPWLNNEQWYVYGSHGYQPSQQGCPIGTVAMWGGTDYVNFPSNWLLCYGQQVSTNQYSALFNAIGYTWGGSGGSMALPPASMFFFNSAGAVMDPLVLPQPGSFAGMKGGAPQQKLIAANMPQLKITLGYLYPNIINGTGTNVPDVSWQPGSSFLDFPVLDEKGVPLGGNQQPIATLPPWVAVFYMIKFL
jgi:Phage Tail Collar Domain